jgi:ubiquinone/menaquinone biosynthesis C-methylase UbiE
MACHVCPWWLGYFLLNPLRRWGQDPGKILGPYVAEGMTVVEPGPGMGFFTLELARRVGASGRVVAVDVQPRMLSRLRRRAERAGLAQRIDARLAAADNLGVNDLDGKVDFVLAFAVVHELPDTGRFFSEARRLLASTGKLFLAEPQGHVNEKEFAEELEVARRAGLQVVERPVVARSRTAVFLPAPLQGQS